MTDLIVDVPGLTVRRASPVSRLLLHCAACDASSIAAQAGIELPVTMLRASAKVGWNALHLAPDEWLLISDHGAAASMTAAFAAVRAPHSLVDISDRNLGLIVEGPKAAPLLAAASPLDLEGVPLGGCTRTIFGKAMIMLWRIGDETYRIEYARSFDDYVVGMATLVASDVS